MNFIVLIFIRGAFYSKRRYATALEARTFKHGFDCATGVLAGGAYARAWCLPQDTEAMCAIEAATEIAKAQPL